jgi:hypothetical protein
MQRIEVERDGGEWENADASSACDCNLERQILASALEASRSRVRVRVCVPARIHHVPHKTAVMMMNPER